MVERRCGPPHSLGICCHHWPILMDWEERSGKSYTSKGLLCKIAYLLFELVEKNPLHESRGVSFLSLLGRVEQLSTGLADSLVPDVMSLVLTFPGTGLGRKPLGRCRFLGLTPHYSVSNKYMPQVTESGDGELGGSRTFCQNLIRFALSRKIQRGWREAFCVFFSTDRIGSWWDQMRNYGAGEMNLPVGWMEELQ